jgi:glycosyltransferase involved in cell wall biosynthesis
MSERRFRVLAIGAHPVQYMAPLFRRMAAHPQLDLHVAYCTLRGAEPGHDPEFGVTVQWDVPLLEGYGWTHVPNRGSGDESFFGLRNPGLWKLIRQGRFDAVLCFTGYIRASFWIAWVAAKLSRTAFIFGTDAHSLEALDQRRWKLRLKRIFWPLLYRLADQVIVPSSGTRDLMRSLGIPDETITLTPFSVDNDWWLAQSAQVRRDSIRASWGAARATPVVLFCAKLQPWKRPLDLLRGFAKAGLQDALLVFAGEGPLRSLLQAEAASLGIAGQVRFLGFVNQTQLPGIYTSADLMVLPSGYEPFGVVVNEAMLCGCPVVASDRVGAARDLIAPVSPGFIYPCGDVAALAAVLRHALGDARALSSFPGMARARMETWGPRENIAGVVEAVRCASARLNRLGLPVASAPAPADVSTGARPRDRK